MANDTVKSASITDLDAVPVANINAGQGLGGRIVTVDDFCTTTAAGLQSSGSYYKLVRVPTGALPKRVRLAADSGPNLNGALAIQLSWIFSDSTEDGTPSFYQNQIPVSANTGGVVALATYTGVNAIYGFWKPSASASAIGLTEFITNGLVAGTYTITGGFFNLPLWQIFGFTDGRGQPSDPGGYFDLLAYVATGATTGAAVNIYAQVDYAI